MLHFTDTNLAGSPYGVGKTSTALLVRAAATLGTSSYESCIPLDTVKVNRVGFWLEWTPGNSTSLNIELIPSLDGSAQFESISVPEQSGGVSSANKQIITLDAADFTSSTNKLYFSVDVADIPSLIVCMKRVGGSGNDTVKLSATGSFWG